jgi:hypothetical protein
MNSRGAPILVFSRETGGIYKFSFTGKLKDKPIINNSLRNYLLMRINNFTHTLFFIRNDGYILKEFDYDGKLLNSFRFD